MAGEMNNPEKRIRRLEETLEKVLRALDSIEHKLGQVAEDAARQGAGDGGAGRTLIRAQSVGVITAAAGNTLGTGTARVLQVISGSRYKVKPIADGPVEVDVVNDTGFATVDNEYLVLAVVDGLFTCLIGDCATESPVIAPDPPAPPAP